MPVYKYAEGMVWFERMGHHANFVAGLGMLCAVLWYLSDGLRVLIPDPLWGPMAAAVFKGIFGFSTLLLLGSTLIITWKFAQKLWK